jgi:hypothetical protein
LPISFNDVLQFSVYTFCTSFVKFNTKYLFFAAIKWNCFIDFSLEFFVANVQIHYQIVHNDFASQNFSNLVLLLLFWVFLWISWIFTCTRLWHLQIENILLFQFESFSLSFLNYLSSSTSSTVSNRHSEKGHLCLLYDLKGKTFSLLPLGLTLALGFSDSLQQVEEFFFSLW